MSSPTSLRKRGGQVRSVRAGASFPGPTSLNRGEGLLTGLTLEVGGGDGEGGGRGRREDEPNINRDAVDVRFKLRSRTKIAFDMNAR